MIYTQMPVSFLERSKECLKNNDYKGYLENAKKQYELTNSEEDKSEYEIAKSSYEIYVEIQEIIKNENKDPYTILGVDRNAETAEISKKFRKMAFRYHPNKTKVEGAMRATQIIQAAYFKIDTDEKRAIYDKEEKAASAYANYRTQSNYARGPSFDFSDLNTVFSRRNIKFENGFADFRFTESPFSAFSTADNWDSYDLFQGQRGFSPIEQIYRNIYRNSHMRNNQNTRSMNNLEKNAQNYAYVFLFLFVLMMLLM